MTHTLWADHIPLQQISVGKVRHLFEIPGNDEHLLMVASDRISTHDVVHDTEIPGKGENLTALTIFWATQVFAGYIETHIEAFGKTIYDYVDVELPADLHRRALIIRKHDVPQREFVWRSYLIGSLYKAYKKGEDPYGIEFPPGLPKMYRFPHRVFTPTVKGKLVDTPLNALRVSQLHFDETRTTEKAYQLIGEYLALRGIVLVDGKFEAAGEVLVDEFGTGDCCRMAYARDIERAGQFGEEVAWLDKQVARDLAEQMWDEKSKYPLTFDADQVKGIARRYDEAFKAIVGVWLPDWQAKFLD